MSISGTNRALTIPAAATRGLSASRLSVDSSSRRSDVVSAGSHRPPKASCSAVITSASLTTNHATAATRMAVTVTELTTGDSSGLSGTVRWNSPGTSADAQNASAYCPALNTARHGACRSPTDETTTAADWTATAGPRPQPSSSANVKAIDVKTVASGSWPGAWNGRMSTMTASAAMTQNPGLS